MRRITGVMGILAVGIAVRGAAGSPHASNRTGSHAVNNPPAVVAAPGNPLLPRAVGVDGFFPELSLLQKLPTITPAGFEPLYLAEDWQAYRAAFGAAADDLPRKRSSGQFEFAGQLIAAADREKTPGTSPGLSRLLLVRAAAICYRSTGGFPTADKAVAAYQKEMDIRSAAQVGALWTISNAMSRMAVTPKAERIRYSGIAARANMQLSLVLVEGDQIEAAEAVIKMVGYHEGWLKGDVPLRAAIGQTRAVVKQTATMMDYLGTQYQPAIKGDDKALMALYLYGRFVKRDPGLVADFPSRKPSSPMAQLAGALSAAEHDVSANFAAADTLRMVAESLPEGVLKQRTLYASLERYRKFIQAPETERQRVKRTLALMALEGEVADGAKPGITIRPFDVGHAATQPGAGSGIEEPSVANSSR